MELLTKQVSTSLALGRARRASPRTPCGLGAGRARACRPLSERGPGPSRRGLAGGQAFGCRGLA